MMVPAPMTTDPGARHRAGRRATPQGGAVRGRPRRVGWIAAKLRSRSGFSLIEVIVAMLVLTVGLLGMAAGTGWMIRTVHMGELETKRSAALQSAVETVRATEVMEDGEETFGDYTVSWTVGSGDQLSREVQFVLVGPGRTASGGTMPAVGEAVADTFDFRLMR